VEELRDVENFVNARIEGKLALQENRSVPKAAAIAAGAMSLFGEKYGDNVRTIRFGQSIELCGGTHVKNTADIWHFKITSESAVASGIRRIEAITNDAVKDFYFENNRAYFEMRDLLNNAKDPVKALQNLQAENTELKKEIEHLLKEKAKHIKSELKNELTEINGIQYLAKKLDLDASGIKDVCFELGSQFDNLFLLFGAENNGKAILSCYISKELVASKGLNAGTIVRELGKHIQGGGGGQPFFATAGGKNPAGIEEALKVSKSYLE
jgi:alanyl-tRNA synthetase